MGPPSLKSRAVREKVIFGGFTFAEYFDEYVFHCVKIVIVYIIALIVFIMCFCGCAAFVFLR